jgi:hypothetical protein
LSLFFAYGWAALRASGQQKEGQQYARAQRSRHRIS